MWHFLKKDNIDQPFIDILKENMIQNLQQNLRKCKHPAAGGIPTISYQNSTVYL